MKLRYFIYFTYFIANINDAFAVFGYIKDKIYYNMISIYEMCDDKWIPANMTSLNDDFEKKLFGQPFVHSILMPLLARHFNRNYQPEKALVLTLHGWPGTGKTYSTKIIVDNLFRKKQQSAFKVYFSGEMSFPSNVHVGVHQTKLVNIIKDQIGLCDRSLFIFDELDKVSEGILNAIKPFMDYTSNIHEIDPRRSVFIFITNIGSKLIEEKCEELLKQGMERKDFSLSDFDFDLKDKVFNAGGLRASTIVRNNLVDAYIPFLPLERRHVKKCIDVIVKSLKILDWKDEHSEAIIKRLPFVSNSKLFSGTGCKTLVTEIEKVTSRSWKKNNLPKTEF